MMPTEIVVESYEMSLWDAVAHDAVEREAFLERYVGLAFAVGERETSEEWLAEAHDRWSYRPPVLGRMWTKDDNLRTGRPHVMLGQDGTLGHAATVLLEWVMLQPLWRRPSMLREYRPR